jgi:c-di-GMP-related signal transduction protein
LSELLIVDLAVSQLVLSAGIRLGEADQWIKETKRAGKHREVTNSKKNIRWEKICKTLIKIRDDKKYQERSFSISGISSVINHILEVDKQTIIRDFSDHLGGKITGKKYQISDLLNMCNKS